MEQNYNVNDWTEPCPKYDCRKAACKCGLKYVNIPMSLGDDSAESSVAPKNGAYCNALVFYEANGHVYIYSQEGVPTLIDVDASDISTLEQEVIKAQRDVHELREDIDDFIYGFDTVAQMKAATNLSNGDRVMTLGYYEKNDGGGAFYKITNTQPSGHYETLSGLLYAELIIKNTMSVRQFGAKGDGANNDTISIQKAIDLCDEVLVPAGTYMIKAQDDEHKTGAYNHNNVEYSGGIHLKSNLKISGKGTLKAITTDAENYCVLRAYNCDNIEISGIKIIGDRETHIGTSGEYGHGIMLLHCNNVSIDSVKIEQTWGDGIYIGVLYGNTIDKQNKNIIINNSYIDKASRNGVALCSVNGFSLISTTIKDTDRTNPKAGIDIESEGNGTTTPELNNIFINNCTFYGSSRSIYLYTTEVLSTSVESNITIKNCNCYSPTTVGVTITNKAEYTEKLSGKWLLDNISIIDSGWTAVSINRHYLTLPELILNKFMVQDPNQGNKNTNDNLTGWTSGSGIVIINTDGLGDAGNIVINEPYIVNVKSTNYINKPIFCNLTNTNADVTLNSPIKLDGLRRCGLDNVLVHDTNEIMVYDGTYYEKLCNPLNYWSILKLENTTGESILRLKSDNYDRLVNGTELTIVNNRPSATFRIDLGSDVATREQIFPFSNTNQFISTNGEGASIKIKKISGKWYATSIIGTWSN